MADDDVGTTTNPETPSEEEIEQRWDVVDDDPDLEDDLGYEAISLDVLVTSNTDKKVMLLPRSEEWIRDDAYVIADFDLACDPVEHT